MAMPDWVRPEVEICILRDIKEREGEVDLVPLLDRMEANLIPRQEAIETLYQLWKNGFVKMNFSPEMEELRQALKAAAGEENN
jgi:hypothetical protein